MTELRPPFRTISLAEFHDRRADVANRVFEDELENDLVAEAFVSSPASIELGVAVGFNVYIDNVERRRIHDKGRAGFRLVAFGANSRSIGEAGFESFCISHAEEPLHERSPMALEIAGRQLNIRGIGIMKYGFLQHAVRDDALREFTARSWEIPDDLNSH